MTRIVTQTKIIVDEIKCTPNGQPRVYLRMEKSGEFVGPLYEGDTVVVNHALDFILAETDGRKEVNDE